MTLEEVLLILLPPWHNRGRHTLTSAVGSCPETITLMEAQALLSTLVVPSEKQTYRAE